MDSVILESVNLNDLAYEEIKKRIISREFAPGQRLVDSQLATIFQISRTPIRDAMRRLTKEGLLTNTSSRGFYVFAPTLKDIDEIFSISGMIETEAAARIIRRLRENPSPRLEEELNILEKKASEVFPMEKDEEFKRYMMELAENQRLANIIHHGKTDEIDSFRAEKSKLVHNRIVLGIRNQDFEYTRQAIEEHNGYGIADATDYVLQLNA